MDAFKTITFETIDLFGLQINCTVEQSELLVDKLGEVEFPDIIMDALKPFGSLRHTPFDYFRFVCKLEGQRNIFFQLQVNRQHNRLYWPAQIGHF